MSESETGIATKLDAIKSSVDLMLVEVRTALHRLNLTEEDRAITEKRLIGLEQLHADLTARLIGVREQVDLLSVAFSEHIRDHGKP